MLPQFGYIVAQAGADYYSSPLPTSPTLSVTNTNNHSALAPLLNKTSSNVILPPPSSFLPKKDIWYRPPSPIIQQEQQQDHSWQESFKQQEYNDLMTFMDNEFWEQTDDLYKEKLSKLENELLLLQSGTHSVFKEMLSDYELKRDKVIQEAEIYMQYQISFIENHYNQNVSAVEDEYQTEKKNLEESLIEDKKRQMKEDKEEDQDDSHQHRSKRNLRKRNADTGSTLKSEPLTKKRSVRPSTPHNIYTISSIEEEELEMEFLQIKKLVAASR